MGSENGLHPDSDTVAFSVQRHCWLPSVEDALLFILCWLPEPAVTELHHACPSHTLPRVLVPIPGLRTAYGLSGLQTLLLWHCLRPPALTALKKV